MERHVDTREWNRRVASFQLDVALLLLLLQSLLHAIGDDLRKHLANLLQAEFLRELQRQGQKNRAATNCTRTLAMSTFSTFR